MKGLFLFIGESFRYGSQKTRIRGTKESYEEQIKACKSHIQFIEKLEQKFNLEKSDVIISSYTTSYDTDLKVIYEKYLISAIFQKTLIGLTNIFHNILLQTKNLLDYDFVFYIRIDLFLKDYFLKVMDVTKDKILFPSVCWARDCMIKRYPRINDMMMFIPKKYYLYLSKINIYHNCWYKLIHETNIKNDDLDVILKTLHDSDSEKDNNPIYYIVNRPESNIWHSPNQIFDKEKFILNYNSNYTHGFISKSNVIQTSFSSITKKSSINSVFSLNNNSAIYFKKHSDLNNSSDENNEKDNLSEDVQEEKEDDIKLK